MKPILTAAKGTNADIFPGILRLYVPEGSTVADVTYGRGVFWRNVDVTKYNLLASDLNRDGIDARQLPYEANSLDALVFDPPYMHSGSGVKRSLDRCYLNNGKAEKWLHIHTFYQAAALEVKRVLKDGGILILKTQDTVVNHRQLWLHRELMNLTGFRCIDLFVLVQRSQPLMSGKWAKQYHARKNHSYFLIHKSEAGRHL